MPRLDISAAARSRLQSGEAVIDAAAHVVGDQLGVRILAAPEREQDVALGDDARHRRLVVCDQRRADPLLGHLHGRLAQRVRGTNRENHLRHPVPYLHLPSSFEVSRRANRLKRTRRRAPGKRVFAGPRRIDSRAPRAACICPCHTTRPRRPCPRRLGGDRARCRRLRHEQGRRARGRVLFVQKCGVCHTLAQAGTTAQIGPNLDGAFAAARAAGEGGQTIEGIVKAQVEYPRPSNANPAVSMPADIVTGRDLEDVAAYVGRYAGLPGAAPPKEARRPRRAGLRQQRLRRLPHARRGRRRRGRRPEPRRSPARAERRDDRGIDRRPERRRSRRATRPT